MSSKTVSARPNVDVLKLQPIDGVDWRVELNFTHSVDHADSGSSAGDAVDLSGYTWRIDYVRDLGAAAPIYSLTGGSGIDVTNAATGVLILSGTKEQVAKASELLGDLVGTKSGDVWIPITTRIEPKPSSTNGNFDASQIDDLGVVDFAVAFPTLSSAAGAGDVTAPAVTAFSVTNPSGQTVRVTVTSNELAATASVAITGAETATLAAGDFSSNGDGTYSADYAGSTDGTYTATLNTWADAIGNDGAGAESDSVAIDTTAPALPTGFSATGGDGQVSLAWTNPADADLASIKIYRSRTSGSGFALLATHAATGEEGNADTYVDATAANDGNPYYYTLASVDDDGNESAQTSEASATPVAPFAGPLDAYEADVWAAYGLHRLFSSYDGHAIRVREANTDTEADIGFLSDGRLDIFALFDHVLLAAGHVVTTYDIRGNGNDLTQATTSAQPRINAANGQLFQLNGNPAIDFGGSQSLALGASPGFTSTSAVAYYVVDLDNDSMLSSRASGAGAFDALIADADAGNLSSGDTADSVRVNGVADATPTRGEVWSDLGGYAGAVGIVGFDYTLYNGGDFILGGRSIQLNGRLACAVVWDADVSADAAGIETALNSTYGLWGSADDASAASAYTTTGLDGASSILIDEAVYDAWPWSNVLVDTARGHIGILWTSGAGHLNTSKEVRFVDQNPTTGALGTSVLVTDDESATIHGACIASNGDYLAFPRRSTGGVDEPPFTNSLFRSTDGGATWSDEGDLSIVANGVLHGAFTTSAGTTLLFVRDRSTDDQQQIARSTDVGASGAGTWSTVDLVSAQETLEGFFFEIPAGEFSGRIVCYMRHLTSNQPRMTYSDDDGATWAVVREIAINSTMDNGNMALCDLGTGSLAGGVVEAVWSSRFNFGDGDGSIFRAVTTYDALALGRIGASDRIQAVYAGIDSGYPAHILMSGTVHTYWYDDDPGGGAYIKTITGTPA